MSTLTIFSDTDAVNPLWHSAVEANIAERLGLQGIHFSRWSIPASLPPTTSSEAHPSRYQPIIDILLIQEKYQSWDIITITPDNPQISSLRQQFLAEHTHGEDEVRLFVEGSGLFCLHLNDKIFQVFCEKGDFIAVPAKTPHWFDMGSSPSFTAIRLFNNPEGWLATFTGSNIAKRYPLLP